MRNLVLSVAALATLAVMACGASSKEVAMARTARYKGDKLELFAAAKAAVEDKYTLQQTDETTLRIITKGSWVSPEGLTQNPRGEGAEMIDLIDKSINFALVVELLPEGDAWVTKTTAVLARYNRGIPKPEPLQEGDISLPGWVQSKIDSMVLDLHKALAKWEVKTGGPQMAPPPTEPAPAAPADGSAAAPADGSAAGPADAPADGSAATP